MEQRTFEDLISDVRQRRIGGELPPVQVFTYPSHHWVTGLRAIHAVTTLNRRTTRKTRETPAALGSDRQTRPGT